MTEIVHGDNGQWAVVVDGKTTWFYDEQAAKMFASVSDLTPEKASEVLDGIDGLYPW